MGYVVTKDLEKLRLGMSIYNCGYCYEIEKYSIRNLYRHKSIYLPVWYKNKPLKINDEE